MSLAYKVIVHNPIDISLILENRVNESSFYFPSEDIAIKIDSLKNHQPRAIGIVSEMVAMEVLEGSKMQVGKKSGKVSCEDFKVFTKINGFSFKPDFGIRCDDLIVTINMGGQTLIFITECKGTTRKQGFSHTTEAKIFYQLPRTIRELKKELAKSSRNMIFGGAISFEVDHYAKAININLLDKDSSMCTDLPDSWMYVKK